MRVTPIRRWTPEGWVPAGRLFHYLEQLVVALGVYEDATSTIPSGFPTLSTGAAGRLVQAAESVRYEVRALTAPPAPTLKIQMTGAELVVDASKRAATGLERLLRHQQPAAPAAPPREDASAASQSADFTNPLLWAMVLQAGGTVSVTRKELLRAVTAYTMHRLDDGDEVVFRLERYTGDVRNGKDCDDGNCCTHNGALGPCMPNTADGRCIWCGRELPAASARPKDCDDGDPGTGAP